MDIVHTSFDDDHDADADADDDDCYYYYYYYYHSLLLLHITHSAWLDPYLFPLRY